MFLLDLAIDVVFDLALRLRAGWREALEWALCVALAVCAGAMGAKL